jgi:hypothetical protein
MHHVVTAHHVVAGEKQIEIEVVFDGSGSGTPWRGIAHVSDSYLDQDLSILELEDGEAAERAGLASCSLSLLATDEVKGRQVLGLGYHASSYTEARGILDPCPTLARVAQHLPIRRVGFGDRADEPSLILIVSEGQETIHKGMSGGPILDLDGNGVIAVIKGAQRALVRQFNGVYEELPAVEYGFGVLLSSVVKDWPEFAKYCG